MKGTIVFDFDGVIHSYTSGWQGTDVASDPPVDGIANVLKELRDEGYEVVIVSTRSKVTEGVICIMDYCKKYNIPYDRILAEKPPALVYVDDRAICFDGDTDSLVDKIVTFIPWNKK